MARNKNPEETVNLILEASYHLFIEKGYERTSIQDIIDRLGGLSKGAIYHHFRSKEDILVAVIERITDMSNALLLEIRDRPGLTGKEKLTSIFWESIRRPIQDKIFTAAPNFFDSPGLLFALLHDTVENAAPNYLLPILQQGIDDGSIEAECPEQLAELILFVANVWINPMIFDDSVEDAVRKFRVFDKMMRGFGLDILDERMLERLKELAEIYNKRK